MEKREQEYQKAVGHLTQELNDTRRCLVDLDGRMEEQIESIQRVVFEQRAQLAGSRLAIKMERGSAYTFDETEKSLLEEIERMDEEIAAMRRKIEQIAESLKALYKVPPPAQKENSEEIERLLHKFADIMKVPENAASVEEDRGVSPEKNKE
ncbi:hypothetical protein HAX54_053278 [Datura stramonium]|uniref:Uncharacterized protein n=1 Tax=Datura stramonium TaxID=4076 RepID=A0ABS8T046_DATST|nr:hypothetical protein [Datura stramonium]